MLNRQALDKLAADLILAGWDISSRWEPADLPIEANPVVLEAERGPLVLEVMADGTYLVNLMLSGGNVSELPDALGEIEIQIRGLDEGEDPGEPGLEA